MWSESSLQVSKSKKLSLCGGTAIGSANNYSCLVVSNEVAVSYDVLFFSKVAPGFSVK